VLAVVGVQDLLPRRGIAAACPGALVRPLPRVLAVAALLQRARGVAWGVARERHLPASPPAPPFSLMPRDEVDHMSHRYAQRAEQAAPLPKLSNLPSSHDADATPRCVGRKPACWTSPPSCSPSCSSSSSTPARPRPPSGLFMSPASYAYLRTYWAPELQRTSAAGGPLTVATMGGGAESQRAERARAGGCSRPSRQKAQCVRSWLLFLKPGVDKRARRR